MKILLCGLRALCVSQLLWGLLLLLPLTSHAQSGQNPSILKYEEPNTLTATIYSLDRKTVLFKFSRHLTRSGTNLEAIRKYNCPDGKLAARERVIYHGDGFRLYELDELQTGGFGCAEVKPDSGPQSQRLYFEFAKDSNSRTNPSQDSETLQKNTLNNDMVGPFLASNWDALMKGQEVKCRFMVIPRKETVGFRFVKESESQWQGMPQSAGTNRAATRPVPIIIVRMEPTSPVIRTLVDPLHFKIEKDGAHRVLEYSGRTTPKIKSGNKWSNLDAVTVFDW